VVREIHNGHVCPGPIFARPADDASALGFFSIAFLASQETSMLVGHFAISLLGKRIDPKISVGTLMLAAMLPDVLWCLFMIAGLEQIRVNAGSTFKLEAIEIAYSHSLLTGAIWGGLLALSYFWRQSNRRGAWLVLAAVLSHWVLDVVSHPPDMPLAPGIQAHFGLGLWNSIPATLIIEGGFWVLSIAAYLSVTRARSRASLVLFWLPVAFLTLAWYGNIAGPPPADPSSIRFTSLIFFLLTIGWAYWLEKTRRTR
jgi:hypothetical protein